jgi:hypothetical protein
MDVCKSKNVGCLRLTAHEAVNIARYKISLHTNLLLKIIAFSTVTQLSVLVICQCS